MKKFKLNISVLLLLLGGSPMAAQAETGWTNYSPGLVKVTIERSETVLLGYLLPW